MTKTLKGSKSKAKSSKVVKHLAPSVFYNKAHKIVYLGCNVNETEAYLRSISNYYRCRKMTVGEPKHVTGFEREIVIRGMQLKSDSDAFGLDILVNGEILKHWDKDGWRY